MGDARRRGAPDDLIEQVFLLVPGTALHRVKYVCRRWWNRVNNWVFSFLRGSSDLAGLLLQNQRESREVKYIPLEPDHSKRLSINFFYGNDSRSMKIDQYCCGLLLGEVFFTQQGTDNGLNKNYCVYNPTSRQYFYFSIPLKLVEGYRNDEVIGALLYDPNNPKRFDVVYMHILQREEVSGESRRLFCMQMYSVDTRVLSNIGRPVSIDMNRGQIEASVDFTSAFTWNKCIFYFKQYRRKLFYYDTEAKMCHNMKIPDSAEQSRRVINYVGVGEDDNCLYLIESYQSNNVYIYEAKSLNFEWILKYQIDISNIRGRLFTTILYHGIYKKKGKTILVASAPLLQTKDSVIKYNLDELSYVTAGENNRRIFPKVFLYRENKNWITFGATNEQISPLPVTM